MSQIAAVTTMPCAFSNGLNILAPSVQFDSRTDLLGQRLGRAAGAVGDQAFRETLLDDGLDRLPDQFIAVLAKLLLRLKIQQDDLGSPIYHYHSVGSASSSPPYFTDRAVANIDGYRAGQ